MHSRILRLAQKVAEVLSKLRVPEVALRHTVRGAVTGDRKLPGKFGLTVKFPWNKTSDFEVGCSCEFWMNHFVVNNVIHSAELLFVSYLIWF